jgi:hypothetical protein
MSFNLEMIPVVTVTTRDSDTFLSWMNPPPSTGEKYPAPPLRDYFYFAPTEECERLMDHHQLVCRPSKSGFSLFYKQRKVRVEENGSLVDVSPGLIDEGFRRFTFAIYLSDKEINKRFPESFQPGFAPNLYLNNLKDSSLVYNMDLAGLNIREEESAMNINVRDTRLGEENFIRLQPAGEGGKDSYTRIIASSPDPEEIVYNLSNRFSQSKPFGVLDIFLKGENQNTDKPLNYFISLI